MRHLERQNRRKQRERILWQLLLLVAISTAAYRVDWGALSFSEFTSQPASTPSAVAERPRQCDIDLPQHGSTHVLEPSTIRRSDVLYSGLALDNQHKFPIVVVIGDAGHQRRYEAVTVYPHQKTEVSLPLGAYGLSLMVGRDWCNFELGFTDGHRVLVSRPIEILQGKTNQLQIQSFGPEDTDLKLVSTQLEPIAPLQVAEEKYDASNSGNSITLVLRRQANGGFYVNGTINHVPVVFQIDTGASITSIPRELALNAGIYGCDGSMFDTANGRAFGCLSLAKEITFGNHRIQGFQIASMPNLKTGLLGMNILRYFRIENAGDIMRITPLAGGDVQPPQYQPPVAYQPAPPPVVPQPPVVAEQPPQPALPDMAEIKANRTKACDQSYEAVKDAINARMRQGYSSAEGEVFRERLRQNEKAHHECLQAIG